MFLKGYNSRFNKDLFGMDTPFPNELIEDAPYCFTGGFELLEEGHNDPAAIVRLILFDEVEISNNHMKLADIADMFTQDAYSAMYALETSPIYAQEVDENKFVMPMLSCYLKRLYINPAFRKKGIARYILSNLEPILVYLYNTQIHSIVVCPHPQMPDQYGGWRDADDDAMKARMIKVIETDGYCSIGEGFYAKTYLDYCALNR